jgi:hypothetical protein
MPPQSNIPGLVSLFPLVCLWASRVTVLFCSAWFVTEMKVEQCQSEISCENEKENPTETKTQWRNWKTPTSPRMKRARIRKLTSEGNDGRFLRNRRHNNDWIGSNGSDVNEKYCFVVRTKSREQVRKITPELWMKNVDSASWQCISSYLKCREAICRRKLHFSVQRAPYSSELALVISACTERWKVPWKELIFTLSTAWSRERRSAKQGVSWRHAALLWKMEYSYKEPHRWKGE